MISLAEFIEKLGCEKQLAKLICESIAPAVKKIKEAISLQKGELAGSQNVYGEKQLALDVQSNNIVIEELKKFGLVNMAASEEMEEIAILPFDRLTAGWPQDDKQKPQDDKESAPFTVVFDPLDGSSLVDVNLAVGSIFGVYPAGNPIGRTGDDQLAACFAVYGPRTTLVLTVKKGTHEFGLADDGGFYLLRENLKIAPQSKHFAPGNLRACDEREDYLKLTNDWIKRGLVLRYSGGMVPDINHILVKGNGIFTYPGYSKAPDGKLRLLFECNPMSLLVEQAGGAATDGEMRVLSKKITELHQRTPIFVGSSEDVKHAAQLLSKGQKPVK